jgi:mannitol 2-dehydrogenase
MDNPLVRQVIEGLMDEVTPTLPSLPGIQLDRYKHTLIERFTNPKVRDQLARLCLNGSDKIPKFILGSVRDNLAQGESINYLSFAIAVWFRYLKGEDDQGRTLVVEDLMADTLVERAHAGGKDPRPLLNLSEIFGDLAQSVRLVETVTHYLHQLSELGVEKTLRQLLPQ